MIGQLIGLLFCIGILSPVIIIIYFSTRKIDIDNDGIDDTKFKWNK